jgi:hypothetical protein
MQPVKGRNTMKTLTRNKYAMTILATIAFCLVLAGLINLSFPFEPSLAAHPFLVGPLLLLQIIAEITLPYIIFRCVQLFKTS